MKEMREADERNRLEAPKRAAEDKALREKLLAICADPNPPLVCQTVFRCGARSRYTVVLPLRTTP